MNEDNKYDALKEIFSRGMENHELPVDSWVWEAINNRLNKKSSSIKKIIAIWSAIAASIAIILAMAFLHYDRESKQLNENHNLAENSYGYSETPNDKPAFTSDSTGCETHVVMPQQPSRNRLVTSSPVIQENQIDKSSYTNNDNNIDRKDNNEKTSAKGIAPLDESEKMVVPNQFPRTKKGDKGLLLSASFNTYNTNNRIENNTIIQPPSYVAMLRSTNNYQPGDKVSSPNKALIPDNTPGEHLAPLSFGLNIRKNINKHYGVETGLVYTYLSSNYRWNDPTLFNATQQLHYLGIPVNGIVYLWNSHSEWNVYFSAGAMLEKGLRMKTVRTQHLSDRLVTTTQKSNIDGWQWSLNSSVGISYRLADKVKLYVEPRLGYYFDSNQPVSIRTDQPVSIGFGAGLQLSF